MSGITGSKRQLGQWLIDQEMITTEQLRSALEEQRKSGHYLREVFLRLGMVTEDNILKFFEEELLIPVVKISDYNVDAEIVRLIPEKLARRYRIIPLFKIRDSLSIAMEDPLNVLAIDEISAQTKLDIDPCAATGPGISAGLKRYYGSETSLKVFDGNVDAAAVANLEIDQQVIKFVENVIRSAAEEEASDIHIEPDEEIMRVRFRVDGVLRERATQPLIVHPAVVSRVKILSDLDISERRLPQDGRFEMELEDRSIDLRVSTFPTVHGENLVLRILDKKNAILTLDKLGFEKEEAAIIDRLIHRPNGMILVTGPTGSGKTTTLYAMLQTINSPDRNIQTLEDPVEYLLPMIRQTQINEEIGLTFALGLRALVRQDPDVILIGEMRDQESAEIGVRSSLTGHLVLSTLHTNDAIGALARLIDMGVDRFLLASSLIAVVGQRLLRRICDNCRQEVTLPDQVRMSLGVPMQENEKWFSGKGCDACSQTGYRGRVAVYEIIEITREVSQAVVTESSFDRVRDVARGQNMRSLRQAAMAKAFVGLTSAEEVLRVTKTDSEIATDAAVQELEPVD